MADVVDRGNSLSITRVPGAAQTAAGLVEPTGPTATGSIALSNGLAIELQISLTADSMLLVTLPASVPAMDDEDIALISLRLASQRLDVLPRQLKGLAIRRL